MNNTPNVHTPVVHDDGPAYTASGMRIAPAEVHARRMAREAERWLTFAAERTRMRPETLTRKALGACAFSTLHRASSFAVPSKLAGTSERQRALWTVLRESVDPWAELSVEDTGEGLAVRYGDDVLGEVQPKHLGWVRPLTPFGVRLYLSRVTGHSYDGYTLGCNVVFGHVGAALDRLTDALGSAGASGDGAVGGEPAVSEPATPGRLRLVVRPEHDAVRRDADPDDVVLWRHIDGTACASVPHIARHSPSGLEWGYSGSGPADLARSVLLALTDEATAERLYQRFKAEVVAQIPPAGGVLRAAEVRAWVARQSG